MEIHIFDWLLTILLGLSWLKYWGSYNAQGYYSFDPNRVLEYISLVLFISSAVFFLLLDYNVADFLTKVRITP
jgi:hypothetical protein